MSRLEYLLQKEFVDMTQEEQEEYKKYKGHIILNYMGVPTSESSLALRTKAFLEETRSTSIWDQEKTDTGKTTRNGY